MLEHRANDQALRFAKRADRPRIVLDRRDIDDHGHRKSSRRKCGAFGSRLIHRRAKGGK
jgi:hypothetical protein